MAAARVVVLSDLHLSPTHGFFWENWLVARGVAEAAAPDLVVVNGDLCINGPDSDAEVAFAAAALRGMRAGAETLALPGNHDLGDEPPGQDPAQIIDAARLARWRGAFGADRWARDVGGWQLVGVNAQLLGSGLAEEAEQDAWLDGALAGGRGRPVALFLHKPVFLEHPGEAEATAASVNPAPRARLLARLRAAPVRLVVSGHLHQHRERVVDGVRHVWAPATSFLGTPRGGGDPAVGVLAIGFEGEAAGVEVVRPAGLVGHDLEAMKGHGRWRFLRDMPACPPAVG